MKKIIRNIVIPMTIIISFGNIAFANGNTLNTKEKTPINNNLIFENKESIYTNFYGVVKKIVDMKYFKRIIVSSSEGEMISYNVYQYIPIYNEQCNLVSSLSEGDNVVVAYKKTTPITETTPPQVDPEVLVVFDKDKFKVSVDYYNSKGLSSDGSLLLDTSKTKQILDLNNNSVVNPLNKNIIVVYNLGTLSYPSKISPKNIIVLEGKNEISVRKGKTIEEYLKGLTEEEIYVKDDIKYIKLSTIAQKYGYNLYWNQETKEITVSKGNLLYTLKQGNIEYKFNEAIGYFKSAPIEYNEKTFVEIEFLGKLFN